MVDQLLEDYGDRFIPVFLHLGGEAGSGVASSRATFYDLMYTPYMWFNGDGDGGYDADTWEEDLLEKMGHETDVTLTVWAVPGESILMTIHTVACIEPGGEERTLRIYMGQVLDHFPESPTYYRNAMRQLFHNDVTLVPGECTEVEELTLLPPNDQERSDDVRFVAWAQEPLSRGPAEIFQATTGVMRRTISPDDVNGENLVGNPPATD